MQMLSKNTNKGKITYSLTKVWGILDSINKRLTFYQDSELNV